jgi:hypothetical protein
MTEGEEQKPLKLGKCLVEHPLYLILIIFKSPT